MRLLLLLLLVVATLSAVEPAHIAIITVQQPSMHAPPVLAIDGTNLQGSTEVEILGLLRTRLDELYRQTPKNHDNKAGIKIPIGRILIEATPNTRYEAVQRVIMVITDTVEVSEGFPPKALPSCPFILINFQTKALQQ